MLGLKNSCTYLYTGYGITHDRISHASTRYKIQPLTYWPEQQQKYVSHQVEFVDKNNFEAQSPRRDTSIPSVSAVSL